MTYTLFDLNEHLRRVIALNFGDPVWITAELASCKHSRGHIYLDLIEKGEEDIRAQAQAVIWSKAYQAIRLEHGKSIDDLLQEGMELKLQVRIDYHERYGLKLIVSSIDPTFTLGKMALQRRLTLETLQGEGLLEANKQHQLPLVLQRIAVLSSEDAAGWHDFKSQLAENSFGYRFELDLYTTALQGTQVERELPEALRRVARKADTYDVVVLVRGGGARLDLSAFDSLKVNRAIAEMPLPVLTGIGHDIDETIADITAFAALKTPTAVAAFLIQHNLFFENSLLEKAQAVRSAGTILCQSADLNLSHLVQTLRWQGTTLLHQAGSAIHHIEQILPDLKQQQLARAHEQLDAAERLCATLNPDSVLKRGYSIVRKNKQLVHAVEAIQPGEYFQVTFQDGTLDAKRVKK
ncbi:MAG: exodeoxyribonuclease VII large subunit [Saprospiraceae bacterium]